MGSAAKSEAGRSPLAKLNDAIFAVEKTIVVTFLMVIAGTMFLDLVYGRLVARDSKVGLLIAKLGGVTDEATRTWIDAELAPWLGGAVGIAVLWGAFASADRERGKATLPIKMSALVMALLTAAGIGLAVWLMLVLESKHFYLLVWAAGVGGYAVRVFHERADGWQRRIALALFVATPCVVWFCLVWIPLGYTWSQELSLLMLLWIGFLGASICVHEGKHIRIEALGKLIPPRLERLIRAAGMVCAAAFCAFLSFLGYLYVTGPSAATTSSQMGIPDQVSIVSVPIGLALACIRFVVGAISALRGGDYGRPIPEDEALAAVAAAEKETAKAKERAS